MYRIHNCLKRNLAHSVDYFNIENLIMLKYLKSECSLFSIWNYGTSYLTSNALELSIVYVL